MASKENYMYGQEANELMKDKYLIKAPDNYVRYNIKYTGSLADGVTVSELFDKKPTIGNNGESWDTYLVRKMKEERKGKEVRKFEEYKQAAYEALTGERDDVYPCREDVPADLWGNPIVTRKSLEKNAEKVLTSSSDIQSEHSSVADMVNHPPHYNKGIETSDYIKSWEMNWNQANVVKYVTRYNLKNKDVNLQIQDLRKAQWYLEDLMKELEKQNPY